MAEPLSSDVFQGRYTVRLWQDLPVPPEIVRILSQGGIRLEKQNNRDLLVEGPADLALFMDGIIRLSGPQVEAFLEIIETAPLEFTGVLYHASRFQKLEAACLYPNPHYPHGGASPPPFTVAHEDAIQKRLHEILELLAQKGITLKFGSEMEFIVSRDPIPGFQKSAFDLLKNISNTINTSPDAAEKIKKIQDHSHDIEHFTTRDMMMMKLLEFTPETQAFYQYAFGRDNDGSGYYDNEDVLELKSQVFEGNAFFKPYYIALRKVLETVFETRLALHSVASQHLSFSAWKDGRNILLQETQEDAAFSQRVAHSAACILERGSSLIWSPRLLNSLLHEGHFLGPSRTHPIRYAHGRLEIRVFGEDSQHLAMGALLAAGAALAATDDDLFHEIQKTAQPINPVLVAGVALPNNALPWLRHAVHGCTLEPETLRLQPNLPYLRYSADKILEQMFPDDPAFKTKDEKKKPEKSPYQDALQLRSDEEPNVKFLHDFLTGCRFIKHGDGWKAVWDEDSYDFSKNYTIRADRLSDILICLGISKRFHYRAPDFDQSLPGKTLPASRAQKFKDTPFFETLLGNDLYKKLRDGLEVLYPPALDEQKFLQKLFGQILDAIQKNEFEKDDEEGLGRFMVTIEPLPMQTAIHHVKKSMKIMRQSRSVYNIFHHIRLNGVATQDDGLAHGYLFQAPMTFLNDVSKALKARHGQTPRP